MQVFSINDKKSGTFSQPQFYENSVHAIRGLGILANDTKTTVGIYAEDFDLYQIGEYDTSNGKITMLERYTFVASAKSLQRTEEILPNPKNRK